eukprot:COSAG06_NODE_53902_length_297_cov_1.035354_1_plen_29_part_10
MCLDRETAHQRPSPGRAVPIRAQLQLQVV